jgi:DNA invertase Pin-like site-specific DNA recombinase
MEEPAMVAAAAAPAYSYLRFSSPQQADGDSVRRQTELRDAWLARSGAKLDTSLSLRDDGVSAFTGNHRQNPDRHALAGFLEQVKRGRVPRGSFLIVESLDRLSREHIRPALTLLLNLIDAGVRIVQLLPLETVYDEQVEPMTLMMGIMELSRGHSESKMKSERVGRAWREKKKLAASKGVPVTKRTPSWLTVQGGRFVIDDAKAATVRRIFRLAAEGHGIGAITRRLNAEKVRPIARATYWARSYVAKLLRNPAVFGEYQPHTRRTGKRKAEGQAIAGYFPAVVTEEQFHAARAAMVNRKEVGGGRPTPTINLFTGLLRDALNGGSLHIANKGTHASGHTIHSYKATNGVSGARMPSFPLAAFEDAILSELREIDPTEIVPRGDRAADKVLALTGKLADIEGRIEAIQAQLIDGGEVEALAGAVRKLDARRTEVAADLTAAKAEAAAPVAESWGEYRSLLSALKRAKDPADARVRLRAAMRRMVTGIWCVFAARGSLRLAAVRVDFAGDGHRDYLILHKAGHGNAAAKRAPNTEVRSFKGEIEAGEFDLRHKKDAAKLAKLLATFDAAEVDPRRTGKR